MVRAERGLTRPEGKGASRIPARLRAEDKFHHIDLGFLNTRLCVGFLPPDIRDHFFENRKDGDDHTARFANNHLLITMVLDVCEAIGAPPLLKVLASGKPKCLFRSTEQLEPCPDIYDAVRVSHGVRLTSDWGKPVVVAYHTEHIASSTGRMTLNKGADDGYVHSIVGVVHDRLGRFEIEPLTMGAPWFDHPRNGEDSNSLMWFGNYLGEILPEDIEQFSRMREVKIGSASEWMEVMKSVPEQKVKEAFAALLADPTKKDWAGEACDHFSANAVIYGRRRTAAFLLKGPSRFREMTLEMCGRRGDQIHRMVDTNADISIVQHAHRIGPEVRKTLRALTVLPGASRRKFCLIDGAATYRILKAYSLI